MIGQTWILLGKNGKPYKSTKPGTLGGHRMSRLYGRLTCRAAIRALTHGGYVKHRVFFLNEDTAKAAGYRPCAVCMPEMYAQWRDARSLEGIHLQRSHSKTTDLIGPE